MSIFDKSKSSSETLYILFPLSPTLSSEQKESVISHVKQLENPFPVEVVFAQDLPQDSVKEDELDESGYVWAIRDGDVADEFQLENDTFEQEFQDIKLWITSQVMAINHMEYFGGIEIGDKDENDGENNSEDGEEGEEDEDEDYDPEQEGEDGEDEDDGELELDGEGSELEQIALLKKQMEMLNNYHAEEDNIKDIISPPEVQLLWKEVAESLEKNSLAFTSFKETVKDFVSQLALKNNPLMKMMGQIMSGGAATKDDLDTLIEEVSVPNFPRNQKLSNYPPFILKHKKNIAAKYDEWKDDYEYLTQNFLANDSIDDADLDDSFTYNDREWMTIGADIQRIQVGNFGSTKAWNGQFRFKVDIPGNSIIYYMFEFVPDQPPKVAPYNRNNFRNYMITQLEKFKQSRVFKIVIPFDTLHRIQYHESKVEASLALAVIQINTSPSFYAKRIIDSEWSENNDFSKDNQLSQFATHYLIGNTREWNVTLGYLVKNCEAAKELYDTDNDYDPIELSDEPNFDPPSDSDEQEDTPFENERANNQEGDGQCIIM